MDPIMVELYGHLTDAVLRLATSIDRLVGAVERMEEYQSRIATAEEMTANKGAA